MRILLTLIAISLGGCALQTKRSDAPAELGSYTHQDSQEARQNLIGHWYGEVELEDGGKQRWLAQHAKDGAFQIDFEWSDAEGQIETWSEIGLWGIRLPIYFTMGRGLVDQNGYQPVDGADAEFYEAYWVEALDDQQFIYHSYRSGQRYRLKKVDASFRLDGPVGED